MDYSFEKAKGPHGNPSRETCESTIKRILNTEIAERGSNLHFKTAADFLPYFESLYPASDALTKQVQRAIKALHMPKDENGFFIANKTIEQFEQEQELSQVLSKANTHIHAMDDFSPIFLEVDSPYRTYLSHLLETSETFRPFILTNVETSNGLILFVKERENVLNLLNNLTI